MNKASKFIVCYVTDRQSLELTAGERPESALMRRIEYAAGAGVDWIQIREKDLPARQLLDLARRAIRVCHKVSTQRAARILINDRFDVAWAAGAAGVHLGERSLPIHALVNARRGSGLANFLLGASCHSLDAALRAAGEGADYLFVGPYLCDAIKGKLWSFRRDCRNWLRFAGAVSIPVIAIGGITLENAAACGAAGAAGIAAIRLFQGKADLREIMARLTAR